MTVIFKELQFNPKQYTLNGSSINEWVVYDLYLFNLEESSLGADILLSEFLCSIDDGGPARSGQPVVV
jgi:hypothetical protein